MGVEAISWAFQQPVTISSAKFVLVAMANHADADMLCWPSMTHLCSQTSQDRKTIQANIARLREWGFIVDTGERKGTTKQVIVYLLKTPENGPVEDGSGSSQDSTVRNNKPKNGLVQNENSDESDDGKQPEFGPVKEAQKRNTSENGTGPFFPPKRPVFPHKEARFSHERGPKTGHGTIKEPSGTIKESKPKREADLSSIDLPTWLPDSCWQDWIAHRKSIKAPLTLRAAELCIRELDRLRLSGNNPVAVVEQSVMSGKWSGLFPIKQQAPPSGRTPSFADQLNARKNRGPDPDIIDIN